MSNVIKMQIDALAGTSVRRIDGTTIVFVPVETDGGEEDDGTAGVREPRRPKPGPPLSGAAVAQVDDDLEVVGA